MARTGKRSFLKYHMRRNAEYFMGRAARLAAAGRGCRRWMLPIFRRRERENITRITAHSATIQVIVLGVIPKGPQTESIPSVLLLLQGRYFDSGHDGIKCITLRHIYYHQEII